MTENKLEISLLELKKFLYRRFKNHDRLYWISPKEQLRLTSDLNCFIEDMKKIDVRDHVKANAIELKAKQRVNWKILGYNATPDPVTQ